MAEAVVGYDTRAEYGGFWIRVVAYLIDAVILGIVGGILSAAIDNESVVGLITFVVGIAYFAGLESSARQATLGKSVFGLKVTDLDGNRISPLRAIGRYFAKTLSGLILGIGYLMVAFTARKQGLHDLIASTLVMRTR